MPMINSLLCMDFTRNCDLLNDSNELSLFYLIALIYYFVSSKLQFY